MVEKILGKGKVVEKVENEVDNIIINSMDGENIEESGNGEEKMVGLIGCEFWRINGNENRMLMKKRKEIGIEENMMKLVRR